MIILRGVGRIIDLERWKWADNNIGEELARRDRIKQVQEQPILVRETRYNRRYNEIRIIEMPTYLKRIGEGDSHKRKARVRCRNEEKRNRYWLSEVDRLCDICRKEEDSLELLLKNCDWRGEVGVEVNDLLNESDSEQGRKWLKE